MIRGFICLFIGVIGMSGASAATNCNLVGKPAAPTNLAASNVTSSQVTLSWRASSSSNVTSYLIYRNSVNIASVSSTALSYSNTALSPSTSYVYNVAAKNSCGKISAQSSPLQVKTLAAPSSTPSSNQTINFENVPNPGSALTGAYPSGVIDWGSSGRWYASEPWGLFTTRSLSYNGSGVTSASFTILSQSQFVSQLDIYNGGNSSTTVSISCGGISKNISVAAQSVVNLKTGFTAPCSVVTLSSANGWGTNFDNIVLASGNVVSPSPSPSPSPTPTPTPVPTPMPTPIAGACPQDDGSSRASAGLPQYPSMLNGYSKSVRNLGCKVAGVDYHVGVPDGAVLTDWRNISNSKISMNMSTGSISCAVPGSNVVLDRIDFSTGVGATIYDGSGSCTWTITNSKFGCSGTSYTIYSMIIANNLTLKYNLFDGMKCTNPVASSFITAGGVIDLEYNWFRYATQHILETGAGAPLTYKYNLVDDSVPYPAQYGYPHENWLQLTGSGTSNGIVVSFNTGYHHMSGSGNGEGFQFYCNAPTPCTINSPVLSYNTVVTSPGSGMSFIMHGSDPGTTILNGKNIGNYFDLSGAYGAYYPGSMTPAAGWTSSGNIDMKSGALISP